MQSIVSSQAMISYPIEIGKAALSNLQLLLNQKAYSNVLVLVDENTKRDCYPILKSYLPPHSIFEIASGEQQKQLESCIQIWDKMTKLALDRKALLINLGGGVIGDMGGFVARTYKRGIDFIQVPTTLLSQVDASVGSKLGIDFQGFKNHIGLFHDPIGVYIYPDFLHTLSERELASGFAEVIKHHLIADANGWKDLILTKEIRSLDLANIIRHSIEIKAHIVNSDPLEHGDRKSLNFGHTIGHAIESHLLHSKKPLLHGEAIAIGMICESWISHTKGKLSANELSEINQFILQFYPATTIEDQELEAIFSLALNDKKNQSGQILCTLLNGIGSFVINQSIDRSDIANSLDYYHQL